MRTHHLLPFLLLGLAACDQVDQPYENASYVPPTEGAVRKVLLEDFTGHRCQTCPPAAEQIQQLAPIYGERLVVVGIHTMDIFAAPAAAPFQTDYRTPSGNTYRTSMSISYIPVGMVDRTTFNGQSLVEWGDWGGAINASLDQAPEITIGIDAVAYDAGTRLLTAEITLVPLTTISGDRNLTVYLTEDHLISAQLDARLSDPIVLDYEHRHVLRDTPLGPWGEPVVTGTAAPGDTIRRSVSRVLPAEVTVVQPANLSLVAYTYRTDSREVTQVEERKLQP